MKTVASIIFKENLLSVEEKNETKSKVLPFSISWENLILKVTYTNLDLIYYYFSNLILESDKKNK